MISNGQINAVDIKIQGLFDRYLRFRTANNNPKGNETHLDEDSLNAFVEGKISEVESPSIIKHLIDCSFCLHVTADLAKLNAVFAEDEVALTNLSKEPTRVSEVLNGLLSRIFGTNDGAVFAHHEEEEKTEEDDKKDT